ncbi:hypothetical protein HDIA_3318 [Hartmannibacter diazotrophicus]|uniref:Putative DNA-binding domain-containing protein n=1 Tax=Hartmannibacter diazotrophicus TaxID=1482074 RepID=A0A2C9D9J1_9HYPH|nr:DNA-binding domain-containing protein [Hartmannibacter diazotrophicus]SON56859.1 hypothetical protein HDIA_3318 [Hartmannibacter diazotrophicus]
MSEETQSRFAGALAGARFELPTGLTAWSGPDPERRFSVYRNNVIVGLTKALTGRFPASEAIVGTDYLTALARAFVRARPPTSPVLLNYGDDFPDFVADVEGVEEVPYLPDVMRLEVARAHAYHAADVAPMSPEAIAARAASGLETLAVRLHPSVSIMRSAHPLVTIWAMNAGEMPIGPIDDWSGEDALVARPELTVTVRHLPPGGAAFLTAFRDGKCFADAVGTALEETPDFDLTANLTGLIQAGLIVDFIDAG